jgi:starvation-inducible outer membrane lipoprotein
MQRIVIIAWIVAMSAVLAGCAATPTTGALATPWGVAGIHSFKPEKTPAEPNAAKVDKQVAQLLDDASQTDKDAGVRVAAK